MKDYVYLVGLFAAFAVGAGLASSHYEREEALEAAARAVAVEKMEKHYAEKLAQATDTINTASAEYDDLRAERDRLLRRLQLRSNSGTSAGRSRNTVDARIAACEKLVGQLSQVAAQCGDGWQRCAAKHDALSTLISP